MIQTPFIFKIPNMEVRTCEEIPFEITNKETGETKTYRSLRVGFDNEEGERVNLKDRNLEHAEMYKKGTVGTLHLKYAVEGTIKEGKTGKTYVGEKVVFEINDFVPDKE